MPAQNTPVGRRNAAFTLVELLTVIAIVGVLAAISAAGVDKVRGKARQAGCISNLRQIGAAWHLYLADNNGAFPAFNTYQMYYWGGADGTWKGPLAKNRPLFPYISDMKVFQCPSDVAGGGRDAFHKLSGNCYVMANSNQRGILSNGPATNRVPISGVYLQLQKPSKTILVFEQPVRSSEPGYKSNPTASYNRSNWHPNDVSNILMADGHVETFERAFLDKKENVHPLNPPGYSWGWSYYSGSDW
jgi:prepilin-type N-terminal cleavage/methylation domain-containing protein/prepilin-type processing-associated H-X9-DG protein